MLFWSKKATQQVLVLEATYTATEPEGVVTYVPLLFTLGDSTDSSGLSAEGITGRVLLIFTGVISLLVWVVMLATMSYAFLG